MGPNRSSAPTSRPASRLSPHFHLRQSRDLTAKTRCRRAWRRFGLGGPSVLHLSGTGLQLRNSVPETNARTRVRSDPSASVGMTGRFRLATSSPTESSHSAQPHFHPACELGSSAPFIQGRFNRFRNPYPWRMVAAAAVPTISTTASPFTSLNTPQGPPPGLTSISTTEPSIRSTGW
jgi:hypothetical protein